MNKNKFIFVTTILALIFGLSFVYFKTQIFQKSTALSNREKVLMMYEDYKRKLFPITAEISAPDAAGRLNDEHTVFVDVREKREQDISMIPGAITFKEFERNLEVYADRFVIVYCTIGNRSGRYARALKTKNITAYNIIGGILMWAHENLPLRDEDGPTRSVHVYGPPWNLLPSDHTAVY